MKTFKIPVEWVVRGKVEINSDSIDEALKIFETSKRQMPLPRDYQYVDDTFVQSDGDIEEVIRK